MIIHVLFGQRKCSYPGEYAPEVLEAVDENTQDENPEYMKKKVDEHQSSKDFTALRVLQIVVDSDEIDRLLNPPSGPVHGTVER